MQDDLSQMDLGESYLLAAFNLQFLVLVFLVIYK